jgi:hypothetical protein
MSILPIELPCLRKTAGSRVTENQPRREDSRRQQNAVVAIGACPLFLPDFNASSFAVSV